jgi:hypothetical protein
MKRVSEKERESAFQEGDQCGIAFGLTRTNPVLFVVPWPWAFRP